MAGPGTRRGSPLTVTAELGSCVLRPRRQQRERGRGRVRCPPERPDGRDAVGAGGSRTSRARAGVDAADGDHRPAERRGLAHQLEPGRRAPGVRWPSGTRCPRAESRRPRATAALRLRRRRAPSGRSSRCAKTRRASAGARSPRGELHALRADAPRRRPAGRSRTRPPRAAAPARGAAPPRRASAAPPAARSRAWSATAGPAAAMAAARTPKSCAASTRGVGDRVEPGQRSHCRAAAPSAMPRPRTHSAHRRAGCFPRAAPRARRARRRRSATTSRSPAASTQPGLAAARPSGRAPNSLSGAPLVRGPRARRGIERAHLAGERRRLAPPVEARALPVDLGREVSRGRGPGGSGRASPRGERARARPPAPSAPSSASRAASAPAVSSAPIGVATRCSTGPLSSPSSICMMLIPVSRIAGQDGVLDRRGARASAGAARRAR